MPSNTRAWISRPSFCPCHVWTRCWSRYGTPVVSRWSAARRPVTISAGGGWTLLTRSPRNGAVTSWRPAARWSGSRSTWTCAMTDDDLLRPREVAHMFGVRPTTVARWAREGRLTAARTPGGHRRYLRGEVQKMLDDVGVSLSQARGEKA